MPHGRHLLNGLRLRPCDACAYGIHIPIYHFHTFSTPSILITPPPVQFAVIRKVHTYLHPYIHVHTPVARPFTRACVHSIHCTRHTHATRPITWACGQSLCLAPKTAWPWLWSHCSHCTNASCTSVQLHPPTWAASRCALHHNGLASPHWGHCFNASCNSAQFSSVQFSSVQFSSVQFSSVQPSSVHGAGQPVRTTAPPKAWSFCQSNPLGSQAGSYPRDTRASSRSTGPLTGPANVQRWIGVSPPVLINPKVLKSG